MVNSDLPSCSDRITDQDLSRLLIQQRQDFGWGIRGLTQIDKRSDG